jgi:anti-anti-sigma factor
MREQPQFSTTCHSGHVTVRGEVDLHTARRVTATMLEAVDEDADRVIIDLSGVTFFGARGIASLFEVREAARARGKSLVLTDCPLPVLRTLEATGTRGGFVVTSLSGAHPS